MIRKILDWLWDFLPENPDDIETFVNTNRWVPPPPPLPEERPEPEKPGKPFILWVDENYHFMDEDARYKSGEFDTWEEAAAKGRKIVDETIVPCIEKGETPEEAFEYYKHWGEDPWISGHGPVPDGEHFSAWDYARERAENLYIEKILKENGMEIRGL